ncbi:hypothetical protein TL16_g03493 [Triparma laevis f. inornata]|uniref:Kinesin motor domain-containing protein n=1 Tax=Triparma laevis f. inornata TaxID=1714386 RepID=A0A9W7E258_9STRA|nr:hypothetical protein TL16_g03493 [Triparma laevis f. inornata]
MSNVTFQSIVRARPLLEKEKEAGEIECCITDTTTNSFTITDPTSSSTDPSAPPPPPTTYYFDTVIPSTSPQSDIYETIGSPIIESSLSSKNSVLFSFGVSGSGKTWTLLGGKGSEQGLLPRIITNIFSSPSTTLNISMLEIYNEQIYDLLSTPTSTPTTNTPTRSSKKRSSTSKPLKIHQDSGQFYVSSMSSSSSSSAEEAGEVVDGGLRNVTVCCTGMNESSSRGHTVVLLRPKVAEVEMGQIMIIDMAGLERTKKSATYGSALRESTEINKSIMRLTMLLQPVLTGSFGETNVTMMISAYTGQKDISEKTSLLKEVESLRGLKISCEKNKTSVKSRYSVSSTSLLSREMNEDNNTEKDKSDKTPTKRSPRASMNSPARTSSALTLARKKLEAENVILNKKLECLSQEVESQKVVIRELEEGREGGLEEVVEELEGELERAKEEVERLMSKAEVKGAATSPESLSTTSDDHSDLKDQLKTLSSENASLKSELASAQDSSDELARLQKEVEYLRADNKRLAVSSGKGAAKTIDEGTRKREIEEHRKRQALISAPLSEHIQTVSALSSMQGRGPFKAPAFSLNVPKRWNEGGNNGIKRSRDEEEDEKSLSNQDSKRGKLETVHEKENTHKHTRDDTESDADWISLLESSSVQLN